MGVLVFLIAQELNSMIYSRFSVGVWVMIMTLFNRVAVECSFMQFFVTWLFVSVSTVRISVGSVGIYMSVWRGSGVRVMWGLHVDHVVVVMMFFLVHCWHRRLLRGAVMVVVNLDDLLLLGSTVMHRRGHVTILGRHTVRRRRRRHMVLLMMDLIMVLLMVHLFRMGKVLKLRCLSVGHSRVRRLGRRGVMTVLRRSTVRHMLRRRNRSVMGVLRRGRVMHLGLRCMMILRGRSMHMLRRRRVVHLRGWSMMHMLRSRSMEVLRSRRMKMLRGWSVMQDLLLVHVKLLLVIGRPHVRRLRLVDVVGDRLRSVVDHGLLHGMVVLGRSHVLDLLRRSVMHVLGRRSIVLDLLLVHDLLMLVVR